MGSGLCRTTDGKPRAVGVDGLYRRIVFNYAKQWTRSNQRPKRDKTNTKRNKRDKPIISGPFPVDPDRLEGDKWRYVILTRLDTEPPPERPPRTKRIRRSQQQQQQQQQQLGETSTDGRSGAGGLWDSMRRRSRRRSHGPARPPPPPPPPPCRRRAARRPLVTADLTELVALTVFRVRVCRRLPADRSLSWPGDGAAKRTRVPPPPQQRSSSPPSEKKSLSGRKTAAQPNGFFASVSRVTAMTGDLLSSR